MDPRYDPVTSVVSDEDMSSQLTGPINVTELASNHQLYAVGRAMQVYWMGVLIPVGVLGNLLSLVVLLQPQNRRISFCIYLATLAVCDLLLMLVGGFAWGISLSDEGYGNDQHQPQASSTMCSLFLYCFHFLSQAGTLMVMAMSVDRYIALRYPMRATLYCSKKRTVLVICSLLIFQTGYCLPHLFLSKWIDNKTCAPFAKDFRFSLIFVWISIATNVVFPFSVILFANIKIILVLHKRRTWAGKHARSSRRRTLSWQSGRQNTTLVTGEQDANNMKMSSKDHQLNFTLVLVSLTFLVLTSPHYVRCIVYVFVDQTKSPRAYSVHFLVYHLTAKLYYTNSAINFVLYCLSGPKFRRDVVRTFRRCLSCLLGCGPPGRLANILKRSEGDSTSKSHTENKPGGSQSSSVQNLQVIQRSLS